MEGTKINQLHLANSGRTTQETAWKVLLGLLLAGFYAILFFLMFCSQSTLDFLSFYSSSQILAKGGNPYQVLSTISSPIAALVPANLNPPIILWLFSPLVKFNYYVAASIWSVFSLVLGLIGARIAFHYAFSQDFIKKNGFYLYFFFLLSFPMLMNTGLAQFGTILLFFMMSGYHLYVKKKDYFAGVVWGAIIAIKFFPALIIIYVLVQRRYKVCVAILSASLLLSLLPLIIYGTVIYTQYFSMMSVIRWYGKSWNGSILGMIYRILVSGNAQDWLAIKQIYSGLFFIFLLFYVRKMIKTEKLNVPHQSFCLTLVMMLVLSPFGWLYYFPLLILPFSLTWLSFVAEKPMTMNKFAWFFCLFLLNIPINNLPLSIMPSILYKLTVYSFNFYGLLVLLYLVNNMKIPPMKH